MGYPKALLPLGRGTFLTRILDTLAEAGLVNPVLILGNDAPRIRPAIGGRPARVLINPDPGRGQLSSLQLAVENLDPEAAGCLVWPVDQPAISAKVVRGLIELFQSSGKPLAFPACGEKKGHPVIFHRSLFGELLDAPLESGARSVVLRHQHETEVLPTAETATIVDIDTPEDYLRLTGKRLNSVLARISHQVS